MKLKIFFKLQMMDVHLIRCLYGTLFLFSRSTCLRFYVYDLRFLKRYPFYLAKDFMFYIIKNLNIYCFLSFEYLIKANKNFTPMELQNRKNQRSVTR